MRFIIWCHSGRVKIHRHKAGYVLQNVFKLKGPQGSRIVLCGVGGGSGADQGRVKGCRWQPGAALWAPDWVHSPQSGGSVQWPHHFACLFGVGGRGAGAGGARSGCQEGLQSTGRFLLKTTHPKCKVLVDTVIHASGRNKVSQTCWICPERSKLSRKPAAVLRLRSVSLQTHFLPCFWVG